MGREDPRTTERSLKMNIIILISGNGSNLQAIIDAGIPIAGVISNNPDAYGLTRAQDAQIPTAIVNHKDHPTRDDFDQKLMAVIDSFTPGLIVLAGFMRILTPEFVRHYYGKLINIHPSLLPKYKGLHTHQRVLADKESEHGVSVHFVTDDLDGGPIIAQAKLTVLPDDTETSLEQRIHRIEHKLYPYVIKQISGDHIKLTQDNVYFDGQPLNKCGIMLNL